jgi:hypothetical protein
MFEIGVYVLVLERPQQGLACGCECFVLRLRGLEHPAATEKDRE